MPPCTTTGPRTGPRPSAACPRRTPATPTGSSLAFDTLLPRARPMRPMRHPSPRTRSIRCASRSWPMGWEPLVPGPALGAEMAGGRLSRRAQRPARPGSSSRTWRTRRVLGRLPDPAGGPGRGAEAAAAPLRRHAHDLARHRPHRRRSRHRCRQQPHLRDHHRAAEGSWRGRYRPGLPPRAARPLPAGAGLCRPVREPDRVRAGELRPGRAVAHGRTQAGRVLVAEPGARGA